MRPVRLRLAKCRLTPKPDWWQNMFASMDTNHNGLLDGDFLMRDTRPHDMDCALPALQERSVPLCCAG